METTPDLRIDSLAYGGDGLGRMEDGRVVFVPYTIPGELVRGRLVEDKAKHARAELVEVLEASPARIKPRCGHFGTCGGCHYQHLNYPAQVEAKKDILQEQLERIGGFRDIPSIGMIAAPEAWYYRNHIQFHLTWQGKPGFQKMRSNLPFAIQECHLPEVAINQLWPKIDIEPGSAIERVSLRSGLDEELMVILECSKPETLDFSIEDTAVSVVQMEPRGNIVLAGSGNIIMEVAGRKFTASAGSFFQVNTLQANAMIEQLIDRIAFDQNMTVLDLYCGVGLFSAFLAPKVKRLVGIEVSAEACEDFTSNLDEFDNVELYEASVEDVLSSVNFVPDVIVMDPPRTGLGRRTVDGILTQGASMLAYVSCDPATLARDGKQLEAGGYGLKELTFIDMFPQTYHIESISLWEKK